MSKLKEARELISDKSKWTTHQFARKADDKPCDVVDGEKFCAIGALMYVHGGDLSSDYRADAIILLKAAFGSIVNINDIEGHESVMRLYDRAINDSNYFEQMIIAEQDDRRRGRLTKWNVYQGEI